MERKSEDVKGQTIVFDLANNDDKDINQKQESLINTSNPECKTTKKPTCVIVLGMAGSGKTTFVQRLASHLHMKAKDSKKVPYVINLDPACMEVSLEIYLANSCLPERKISSLKFKPCLLFYLNSLPKRFHIPPILIFEIQLITKKL